MYIYCIHFPTLIYSNVFVQAQGTDHENLARAIFDELTSLVLIKGAQTHRLVILENTYFALLIDRRLLYFHSLVVMHVDHMIGCITQCLLVTN